MNIKENSFWEEYSTDELLIGLPKNWLVTKDDLGWLIYDIKFENKFEDPARYENTIRQYLINFLCQHDFESDQTIYRMKLQHNLSGLFPKL